MGKQRKNQAVILLHGMGRTWRSMWWLSRALRQSGFAPHNTGYPSTRHHIQYLVAQYVTPAVQKLPALEPVHFVTHSLGGILIRQYLQENRLPAGSRIVMLAPPNHGSEVADKLIDWLPYQWLNGPAGQQLGTANNSAPNRLQTIDCDIGVIAGSKSTNPLFSSWIAGENDGKVSVDSAKLDEMKDFLVVHVGHTMIMNHPEVIKQVIHFLNNGRFKRIES